MTLFQWYLISPEVRHMFVSSLHHGSQLPVRQPLRQLEKRMGRPV